MGKVTQPAAPMTPAVALAILRKDNPKSPLDSLTMYATAFAEWSIATENISAQGTIVAHPRTGAPLDNPYLKVRGVAMTTMRRLKRSVGNTNTLWTLAPTTAPDTPLP